MPGNVDRRPWIILSRREAEALAQAARASTRTPTDVLKQAIGQVERQARYIDGAGEYHPPDHDKHAAVQRQEAPPNTLEREADAVLHVFRL